jgi:hypothetical protein
LKNKRRPYICVSYIGLSPTGSGFLYPLYSLANVNVPFVQELGREFEITKFIPFYDEEHFKIVESRIKPERNLGEPGLVAYFDADGVLVESDTALTGKAVRLGEIDVADKSLPLLTRLSLARMANASSAVQVQLLEDFLDHNLGSVARKRTAVAAHKRTSADREFWWDRYEEEQNPVAPSNPFRDMDTEDIFTWLFENEGDEGWTLGLSTLMKKVLYDQRLFDLLITYLSSDATPLEDASEREMAIIGRGLELYSALGSPDRDFADAMAEYALSGEIFYLTRAVPSEIILDFIDQLDEANQIDVAAADIYLEQLGSDVIDGRLAYSLVGRILDSPALGTPYDSRSAFAGKNRLDRLKDLVKHRGRLGLVLDARLRNWILRLK